MVMLLRRMPSIFAVVVEAASAAAAAADCGNGNGGSQGGRSSQKRQSMLKRMLLRMIRLLDRGGVRFDEFTNGINSWLKMTMMMRIVGDFDRGEMPHFFRRTNR